MNTYIRLFGAAFIMLSALFVGREYSSFSDKRTSELRGFLLFVRHVGGRVANFLSYGDELFSGFENESLESCGFLPALRDGEDFADAFESAKNKLSISSSQIEMLGEFFVSFGRDYRDGEIEKITAFLEKYEKEVDRECENMTKNLQVARALLLGGALWAGIMAV